MFIPMPFLPKHGTVEKRDLSASAGRYKEEDEKEERKHTFGPRSDLVFFYSQLSSI